MSTAALPGFSLETSLCAYAGQFSSGKSNLQRAQCMVDALDLLQAHHTCSLLLASCCLAPRASTEGQSLLCHRIHRVRLQVPTARCHSAFPWSPALRPVATWRIPRGTG